MGWFIGGANLISLAYAYIVSMSKDMFIFLAPPSNRWWEQVGGGCKLTRRPILDFAEEGRGGGKGPPGTSRRSVPVEDRINMKSVSVECPWK